MRAPPIVVASIFALAITACSDRSGDYHEDFTQEVERICEDYCAMNLACREPPAFESVDECESICLDTPYLYNDSTCGQAERDMYACIASTATCDLFDDTYNVHAESYTCKPEKDRFFALDCGQSGEDPSQGAP
jgi:hypothetical protein